LSGPSGSDSKTLVLQATDLVELVGQTVSLKRRGKDFVGLCPFHQEKTPSFKVDPARQYFYCFGCKTGGSAIDFVMKRDRIEFIDALKLLAERAGIQLPRFGGSNEDKNLRQQLLDAQSAAGSLFEKWLNDALTGKPAREYLASRGFNAESIKRFQIGVAPDAWDSLLRSPLMKKFDPGLLFQAGLVKSRGGGDGNGGDGHYDTFRNRLMFPIRDENGRIIAFGGRIMPGSEDPAKYLNSPETPLFSKSKALYGIDLARQKIVETRTVAVVEGYTDVVMAHQFGASNVVATLGTAMTEQHVSILRRFANRIVLLFDADTAGDLAVNRAVELFLAHPIEIAIASMPEGVDPDEYLLEHGAAGFAKMLADATDALSYKWKQLVRQFNAQNDLTAQENAVKQYLEVISGAKGTGAIDPIRWGSTLTRVSKLTEIPVDQLHARFSAAKTRRPGPTSRSDDSGSSAPQAVDSAPQNAQERAERWILGVLLLHPERWHDVQQRIHAEDFSERLRKLAEIYWNHQRDEGEPTLAELISGLESELTQLAITLADEMEALQESGVQNEQTLTEAIKHLDEARKRREEAKLVAELRRTTELKGQQSSDTTDEVALLAKLQEQARRPDLRRVGK
jgi:DNA primase